MTALAAALAEVGAAIAEDARLVAKLPPRGERTAERAPAPDSLPGAPDDDQRRADRRYDRDYAGAW